jgi:hypothetical protein
MATVPNIFANLNPATLPVISGYPAVNLALFDQNFADIISPVNLETGAVLTGTTTIPLADTIPTNSQGTQIMSLAITPKLSTSKLRIDVLAMLSHDFIGVGMMTVGLFQDTTVNALACISKAHYRNNPEIFVFTHYMTSGLTVATTFYVRAGSNQIGNMTFNGYAGNRIFGGSLASSITITEIAA